MHAYCVIGPPPSSLSVLLANQAHLISHQPADTLTLEPNEKGNLSIQSVRSLMRFFATPPQGDQKVGFLPQADKLTLPAAQALLKTLEEPPPYALLVLVSPTTESLLPTILSRCQVIYLQTPPQSKIDPTIATLMADIEAAPPSYRLGLISGYTGKRDNAKEWCRQAITYYRELLIRQPQAAVLHNLKQLETAYDRLNANAHVALTLDTACLKLHKV
jgi:DNA polymerase III gamma/tau subunit